MYGENIHCENKAKSHQAIKCNNGHLKCQKKTERNMTQNKIAKQSLETNSIQLFQAMLIFQYIICRLG